MMEFHSDMLKYPEKSENQIFETERLYVRRLVLDDLENFYLFNSDEQVMRYIRKTKTREESKEFLNENIQYYSQNPQFGRWALIRKLDDQYVGSFMLKPSEITKAHEMGYALMTSEWGRGYATEAVRAGLQYAFVQLQLPEIIALTYPANSASQKVLLKCGFQFDRKVMENGNEIYMFRKKR